MGSGQNFVDAFNSARKGMGRMIGSAGDFLGRLRDQMTGQRFSQIEQDNLMGAASAARAEGVPMPGDGTASDYMPGQGNEGYMLDDDTRGRYGF